MNSPTRSDLPFFAYGLFRRGQLGFLRVRDFVERATDAVTLGELLERDGLAILDPDGRQDVEGSLLSFSAGHEEAAYRSICELEPDAQYFWQERDVRAEGHTNRANVLVGRSPKKGSVRCSEPWDGRHDPLFTAGLDVVRETLDRNGEFEWTLHALFRLQMAYMLLWSAIERYASFRHQIGGNPVERVLMVSSESSFAQALMHIVPSEGGRREVFRADDPQTRYRLDPANPRESMLFYYQIRNNSTHRGKAAYPDFELVRDALHQLLSIFDHVLTAAFKDAA